MQTLRASADPRHRRARTAAVAAGALGVLYAAISAYWALGGTWLLNTVGGSLEHRTALAWHAFLWDPWFLAWGLLACATLGISRGAADATAPLERE